MRSTQSPRAGRGPGRARARLRPEGSQADDGDRVSSAMAPALHAAALAVRLTVGPSSHRTAAGLCLALLFCCSAAAQSGVRSFGRGLVGEGAAGPRAGPASMAGGRVFIDVVDRPLGAVLDYISRVSGFSIVAVPDSIRQEVKVSVRLDNIYWRSALDVIADKYNLEVEDDDARDRILKIRKPKPIRMKFPDQPVKKIFQDIAVHAEASIVIPDTIDGQVTANFENVPWPDAIEEVARAAGCVVVVGRRGVIRIARPEELETQMETLVLQLRYLQAGGAGYRAKIESDVAERIKAREGEGSESLKDVLEKVKSEKGTVAVLKGTNSLVATDTSQKLQVMERLVVALDRPPKEVHLSVKIIELSDSDAEEIGILWQNGITAEASGMSLSTMFPFSPGSRDLALSGTMAGDMGVIVPEGGQPMTLASPNYFSEDSVGQLTLGTLSFAKLTALLQFIRTQTTGRVAMSLQIIALDHEEATIHVGELVRYAESFQQTTETGAIAAGFKEASRSPVRLGIQLLVIPHVTGPDNHVILTVIPQTESAKGATLFEVFEGGPLGQLKLPQTQQRTVVTKMMLRDRETGIIAGLRQRSFGETVTKVPVLGDIPLIGWLFRHRSRPKETNKSSNLLLLITPTVIDFEEASNMRELVKAAQDGLGKDFQLGEEAPALPGEAGAPAGPGAIAPAAPIVP